MELEAVLARERARIEQHLEQALPPATQNPPRIHEAIRYAVLAGGKRLRPILTLLSTELVGGRPAEVLDAACALELIHGATLLLDDLPAMDDARLRRGQPTAHVVFGESTAILAAVGLLVHAFDLVAGNARARRASAALVARAVHETALATGSFGLVAGQYQDLNPGPGPHDLRSLEFIHSRKTGQLFVLAAVLGPLLAGASEPDLEALRRYARNVGLAYQVVDDLLDRERSEVTGKDSGKDEGRTTFASLVAPDEARRLARDLVATACGWVRPFGKKAGVLEEFARALAERTS